MNELKKLFLPIKECFKFLNAFGFGLKNKIMFFIRQGFQIHKSIVRWVPIKMMYYPAFRQWLSIRLFPNIDMFKDIARFCSPWIIRFPQKDIAIGRFNPATLGMRRAVAFSGASLAYNIFRGTGISTINALIPVAFIPSLGSFLRATLPVRRIFTSSTFKVTLATKFRITPDWLTTYRARMLMCLFVFFTGHGLSIAHRSSNIKIERLMRETRNPTRRE